jgi:hypothetical protein
MQAEQALTPFVRDNYRKGSICARIGRDIVYIPRRLLFCRLTETTLNNLPLGAKALLTRSTDGYLRQRALKEILGIQQPWVAPFVVLAIGEYGVEIAENITASMGTFDRALYEAFVRENRKLMRTLRGRAISCWDRYYRQQYPDRSSYPGVALLRELERWALGTTDQRSASGRYERVGTGFSRKAREIKEK